MQDIRLAVRHLLARPSFSVVAILTLALGIGANTAVFTVFNAVLLAPLPYTQPDRVVILNETSPQLSNASVTRFNYDDWRARARSFCGDRRLPRDGHDHQRQRRPRAGAGQDAHGEPVAAPGRGGRAGRGFAEAEDRAGAEGVAMVSAALARRRFPAGAVGDRCCSTTGPYTVIGVMPARFELFQPAEVYVPFGPWAATLPNDRGWHPGIFPIARLADGVTLEQAREELDAISRQLEVEFADSNTNVRR